MRWPIKGEMMKSIFVSDGINRRERQVRREKNVYIKNSAVSASPAVKKGVCKVILPVILLVLVFLPFGCRSSQPGETAAEGNRRHKRVSRINQQEMMTDIDAVLLLDEPSRLSDKRIP